MKRLLMMAAAGMFAAPAFAGADLIPVNSVKHVNYDMATGQVTNQNNADRTNLCWRSDRTSGFFTSFGAAELAHDWGDLPADCCDITCFQIGYATDSSIPITVDLTFYIDDNGFDTIGRTPVVCFRITGLPGGSSGPGVYNGWLVTFNLTSSVNLCGAVDLDADGNGDYAYTYNFRTVGDPLVELAGPLLADADPNAPTFLAPGIEDAFDLFVVDPNNPPGPNDWLLADINTLFDGTYWFGGPPNPFAQFYFAVGTGGNAAPACNQPGCETSDINGDCLVDINDLAILLSNFGTPSGAVFADGDIEPTGGDGDVDITDLAVMLSDFGTNCN